ncbi:hypothetical protein G6M78_20040 [Agrobacterium tumefaciens]|uniref:hypothetical protein n=1 Tax=Agrobacterium tumefaciens TaxID=358 RepID=UPI001571F027|nr:hypothetical protein [Agrobacterium tumefaciens]NTE57359.1 hypothetical protein [Agrobacterium tumefaciens]NTE71179.1 hypothetical protein [Agrobacterium tumefaciens]
MAKNMPVPNTRILNGKKTKGNKSTQFQSVILNISRLLFVRLLMEELRQSCCFSNFIHTFRHGLFDAALAGPSHPLIFFSRRRRRKPRRLELLKPKTDGQAAIDEYRSNEQVQDLSSLFAPPVFHQREGRRALLC